ncbi:hypothetical protein [Kitasatospora sp. NPDC004531]
MSRNLITSAAKCAATTVAAAALVLTTTAGAGAAEPTDTVPKTTTVASAPLFPVAMNTDYDQWTYRAPAADIRWRAGRLYKGKHYFSCWTYGQQYTAPENGRTSSVWLRTDDDSGNSGVYASETYLDAYGWQNDLTLLNRC